MNAILFGANPGMVDVNDGITHLSSHNELYWEVLFPIRREQFNYPIKGYIHISGKQVEYIAEISDIIEFSPNHYEDRALASKVKPERWIKEWKDNIDGTRNRPWKNALVMTRINPFQYDTYKLKRIKGDLVTHPPQGYVRVIPV